MKVTPEDIALAKRFVFTPEHFDYGTSMAAAKVSPAQLDRLLKLGLIKISTDNYCGSIVTQKPAKGWLRTVTTFLRTSK